MNPIQRLTRYITVWSRFDEIRKLDPDRYSLEEIVEKTFTFCNGFFAPLQIQSEILDAMHELQQLRPKYIVEVGTAAGGTLLLWTRIADPQAIIVTIDLPGGKFGGGGSWLRLPLFRRLPLPGQTVHVIRGDSHDPATLDLTTSYLRGNPVDFLFIDADHTPAGVRADYATYSPMVRKGGKILFHDIAITNPVYGVRDLWTELKQEHSHHEFIGRPRAFGLGLMEV